MSRTSYRYCGNLNCSFTIEPCLAKTVKGSLDITILHLKIKRQNYELTTQFEGNMDIFTIYSDGSIVLHLEVDTFNNYENDYVLFLNNSKTYNFEAITYPSWISKALTLETSRIENCYHFRSSIYF
uniref:Galectin n=1 Tax=Panagrolaimus sp. PS1159 TaxID=55785 RepID=A0AC35FHD3_9BILA